MDEELRCNNCDGFCLENDYCQFEGPSSDDFFDELAKIVYSCKEDCSQCPDYDDCIRDEKLTGWDLVDPVQVIKDNDITHVSFCTIKGVNKVNLYWKCADGHYEQYVFHNPSDDSDKVFSLEISNYDKHQIKDILDVEWDAVLFDCVYYPIKGGNN